MLFVSPRLYLGAPAEAVIAEAVIRVAAVVPVTEQGEPVIRIAVSRSHTALLSLCQTLYTVTGIGCLVA